LEGFRRFASSRTSLFRASEIREILKLTEGKEVISLAGGLPDPRVFPKEELAEIARQVIAEYGDMSLQYSPTMGVTAFRMELASYLRSKGIAVREDDEIIVTTGSQEALFIIARTLIDPGDTIIVEEPTYLAAVNAFREHGAAFEAVPLDSHGMRTDILEDKLKELKKEGKTPKLLYTVPTSQNPSGATMTQERRKHLVELAEQYDFLIVEDDPYSYFLFEDVYFDYIKTLDKNYRVIYVSTASKILAPGIRLGWIVAHKDLVRLFEVGKQSIDLHTPTLSQYIMMEAIKRGVVDRTIEVARSIYREKRDVMMEALDTYLAGMAEWTRPLGGFFTMVTVKANLDMKQLLEEAVNKYRVAYVPGESFFPVSKKKNTMRLNFSYPPPELIEEGVKRIGLLLRDRIGQATPVNSP